MQGPQFIPYGQSNPSRDKILQMIMVQKMQQQQQSGGAGGGGAAGGAGGASGLASLYKLLSGSSDAASSAASAGAGFVPDAATLAADGGMSTPIAGLPSMSTDVMQSLSNGGNGLQSVATGGATPVGEASTMASVSPYLGLAGAGLGAYGMYKGIGSGSRKATGLGGAALGGGLAMAAPLLGLGPIGWGGIAAMALAGGAGGAMLGHIRTGKSMAQQGRDQMRGNVQGILGLDKGNYSANGFDFGADGKHTFKSADGGTHRGYEVDMSDPLEVSTIPALHDYLLKQNPNMSDVEQKQTIGMLANIARQGAGNQGDVSNNVQKILHGGMRAPGSGSSIDPGFDPNMQWQTNKPTGATIPVAKRSSTRSPDIGMNGQRINY